MFISERLRPSGGAQEARIQQGGLSPSDVPVCSTEFIGSSGRFWKASKPQLQHGLALKWNLPKSNLCPIEPLAKYGRSQLGHFRLTQTANAAMRIIATPATLDPSNTKAGNDILPTRRTAANAKEIPIP